MTLKNKYSFIIYFIFFFVIFLFSQNYVQACRPKVQLPEWIHSHQSDANYFTGVGYAPIFKRDNSHIEKARKDALNELASEISVNIFSSNVLITLVKNDKIYDEFNSLINTRVRADIEGYELVDSYSDKKNYWVYYRLSKRKYYEVQEKKRIAATQNALSFYRAALFAKKNGDYKLALINYVKTIDAVKLYLNESIVSEIGGVEENIVVNAYQAITSILTNLRFAYPYVNIPVVLAEDIDPQYLNFQLVNQHNEPMFGFPLIFHYSERAISHSVQITDLSGKVQFQVPKVRSNKSAELITLSIDVNALLAESSADYAVRRSIQDIALQTLMVPVYINKPTISFHVDERNFNRPLQENVGLQTLIEQAYAADYRVVEKDADYECYITTNAARENLIRGIHNVVVQGQIILKDRYGNIKHISQISPIKGVHLSAEKAAQDAYKNLSKQITNRYFREIEEAILR